MNFFLHFSDKFLQFLGFFFIFLTKRFDLFLDSICEPSEQCEPDPVWKFSFKNLKQQQFSSSSSSSTNKQNPKPQNNHKKSKSNKSFAEDDGEVDSAAEDENGNKINDENTSSASIEDVFFSGASNLSHPQNNINNSQHVLPIQTTTNSIKKVNKKEVDLRNLTTQTGSLAKTDSNSYDFENENEKFDKSLQAEKTGQESSEPEEGSEEGEEEEEDELFTFRSSIGATVSVKKEN